MLQVTSFPFTLAGPGQTAVGQVEFTSPVNASYTAAITADQHSIFSVTKVTALRPTVEWDDGEGGSGDGVHGKPHKPVKVIVDEPVGSSNGINPLNVLRSDKILATIQMVCPNDPDDTYSATLTITSSNSSDTTGVPLSVATGQIDVQVLNENATAAPGSNATWSLSVRSLAGRGANVSFTPLLGGSSGSAAPPASVSVPPVTKFLPHRGQEMFAITGAVGDITPPGSYGFAVAESIFDGADTFSPISLSLTVTDPSVLVTSSQPSTFGMVQGTTVEFDLHVQLQGSATTLDVTIDPPPSGVTCTFLDAQSNPIPAWHLDLTTKEQIPLTVRVGVAEDAALTTDSLRFSWSAYAGTESGSLGFGITVKPVTAVFTPSHLPIVSAEVQCSAVRATFASNGDWTFSGKLHDFSSVVGDNFAICFVFNFTNGGAHGPMVTGQLGSSLTRNPENQVFGMHGNDTWLAQNWQKAFAGGGFFRLYTSGDLSSLLSDVGDDIKNTVHEIWVSLSQGEDCPTNPDTGEPDCSDAGTGDTGTTER